MSVIDKATATLDGLTPTQTLIVAHLQATGGAVERSRLQEATGRTCQQALTGLEERGIIESDRRQRDNRGPNPKCYRLAAGIRGELADVSDWNREELAKRCLRVLAEAHYSKQLSSLSCKQLRREIPNTNSQAVAHALRLLVERGVVEKIEQASPRYRLADVSEVAPFTGGESA